MNAPDSLGIIPIIIYQHATDAAHLYNVRAVQAVAPHVKLHHLKRFDDRLAAHLDGIAVAGEWGRIACNETLEAAEVGALFVSMVCALTELRTDQLETLLALAEAVPESRSELDAAFAWVEAKTLRGIVAALLTSRSPMRRAFAVGACSAHRVDPGVVTAKLTEHPDQNIRARAFRAAGELGRRELVSASASSIGDEEPACAFWAAWAAVMLGDREVALDYLASLALAPNPFRAAAWQLTLLALPAQRSLEVLKQVARDAEQIRWLIRGTGFAGDPVYVPWLINQMASEPLARLAGEAFSLITGADLAWLDLERKPPESFEGGPDDDPHNANIEMDMDGGLPWPDPERVRGWWARNESRFVSGQRYFLGAPITRAQCIEVLKNGYQRQRDAAAQLLVLLQPGSVLFDCHAPVWRQQRELARLS
jgi:uncharacterized protein (TIGR02270 family)